MEVTGISRSGRQVQRSSRITTTVGLEVWISTVSKSTVFRQQMDGMIKIVKKRENLFAVKDFAKILLQLPKMTQLRLQLQQPTMKVALGGGTLQQLLITEVVVGSFKSVVVGISW